MEQRPLRLGDLVDDYCPRERRVTNHAVVAIVGESIRQTRCTTCDFEHPFKDGKPPRRRKKDEKTELFEQVLNGAGSQLVAHAEDEEASPVAPEREATPERKVAQAAPIAVPHVAITPSVAAPVALPAPAPLAAVVSTPLPTIVVPQVAAPAPVVRPTATAPVVVASGAQQSLVRPHVVPVPVVAAAPVAPPVASEPAASEGADDYWPAHRRLIRAQLPKIEGQQPAPRPIHEFTMRPPGRGQSFRDGGASNDNRGNQRGGGGGGFRPGKFGGGGGGPRPPGPGGPGGGGRPNRQGGRGKRPR